ncbi:hypothetical protein [Falsiruegeria mediterranea]|uniref:hypothetical protein n=1 Tax=Falsiruegeria mediterranea TaxID=1280832 RepID=UPI0015F29C2C|nr:hypothetical protein [Falsiruegeria mediterranea]
MTPITAALQTAQRHHSGTALPPWRFTWDDARMDWHLSLDDDYVGRLDCSGFDTAYESLLHWADKLRTLPPAWPVRLAIGQQTWDLTLRDVWAEGHVVQ